MTSVLRQLYEAELAAGHAHHEAIERVARRLDIEPHTVRRVLKRAYGDSQKGGVGAALGASSPPVTPP